MCGGLTEECGYWGLELSSVVLVEALQLSVFWRAGQALQIIQVPHRLHTRPCSLTAHISPTEDMPCFLLVVR